MLSFLDDFREWVKKEANFFRVHLLFFLIVPLISAGIFYAANGRYPVPFIDALFLCYSALTVTGLSTINLSTCTVFQQVILYVLMGLGDVTIVAWVMVLIRKRYFVQHLESLKRRENSRTKIKNRFLNVLPGKFGNRETIGVEVEGPSRHGTEYEEPKDRIKAREGIGAALVGGTMGIALGVRHNTENNDQSTPPQQGSETRVEMLSPKSLKSFEFIHHEDSQVNMTDANGLTSSPQSGVTSLPGPTSPGAQSRVQYVMSPYSHGSTVRNRRGVPIPRRQTVIIPPAQPENNNGPIVGQRGKDQGLGGFPGPIQLTFKLANKFFPRIHRWLEKMITEPMAGAAKGKSLQQLSEEFSRLIIGRNSDFDTDELDDDELERLGGLEYRALDFLSYCVIGYFVGVQLISITLIAPWLSTTNAYNNVFTAQPRLVNKPWFSVFQVMGAYTGGGMSLVDAGMVPFQQAYLMIFAMIFAILAGNHGLPIFLRFIIWFCTKLVPDDGPADRALHFLLDHPRRCFLYLFPSHVTWFLVAALCFFTAIEWAAFIVLNIGLDVTNSLPSGTRAVAGLFQSFATRASGFSIVSIAACAPAFQFLCIIMMYIAIYPVALSIRSTNVYEERSLGVFELPPEDEEEEPAIDEKTTSRRERIGKYFGWHLRRQVAYDIWWLVCGIFLICIIERTKIMDDNNAPWFNIFRIVFELVSAFGGIGLTLGIPTENFAFSGAFGPLSKLVVIVIMVRGRHRGLPVAIDRAILLPEDLVPAKREGDPSIRSPMANSNGNVMSPLGGAVSGIMSPQSGIPGGILMSPHTITSPTIDNAEKGTRPMPLPLQIPDRKAQ